MLPIAEPKFWAMHIWRERETTIVIAKLKFVKILLVYAKFVFPTVAKKILADGRVGCLTWRQFNGNANNCNWKVLKRKSADNNKTTIEITANSDTLTRSHLWRKSACVANEKKQKQNIQKYYNVNLQSVVHMLDETTRGTTKKQKPKNNTVPKTTKKKLGKYDKMMRFFFLLFSAFEKLLPLCCCCCVFYQKKKSEAK